MGQQFFPVNVSTGFISVSYYARAFAISGTSAADKPTAQERCSCLSRNISNGSAMGLFFFSLIGYIYKPTRHIWQ